MSIDASLFGKLAKTEDIEEAYVPPTAQITSYKHEWLSCTAYRDLQLIAYAAVVWCMLELALNTPFATIMIVVSTRRAVAVMIIVT